MKLNLIYYKNILDLVVKDFFDEHQNDFTKSNGNYVLSSISSKSALKKDVISLLKNRLMTIISPKDKTYDYYFIIGSCYPKDNILLKFKDATFPETLQDTIDENPSLKWKLAEDDICIDINAFNEIFINFFNKMMKDRNVLQKMLGSDFSNVVAISHKNLDCYMMFKTIKWAYGNSNCINIWKEKMPDAHECLVAINELISKNIKNKSKMNKSSLFKKYALEAKCYLDEVLSIH